MRNCCLQSATSWNRCSVSSLACDWYTERFSRRSPSRHRCPSFGNRCLADASLHPCTAGHSLPDANCNCQGNGAYPCNSIKNCRNVGNTVVFLLSIVVTTKYTIRNRGSDRDQYKPDHELAVPKSTLRVGAFHVHDCNVAHQCHLGPRVLMTPRPVVVSVGLPMHTSHK